MENRIYGKKFEIDTEKTRKLYDKRAVNLDNMASIYTSVLLGDQNPEYADEWNKTEKDMILPYLDIDSDSQVLDLGCGIGRWAENLMPLCRAYVGIDFSSEMISVSKRRCAEFINENKYFLCSSVQDYLNSEKTLIRPDTVIFSYVCMYINDSDIEGCFRKLLDAAEQKCTIYFLDTVALKERLTLNEIYSSALKSDYSALYRTVEEYDELFGIFEKEGFKKVSQGFMPKLNSEVQYSETDRHYTILKRV